MLRPNRITYMIAELGVSYPQLLYGQDYGCIVRACLLVLEYLIAFNESDRELLDAAIIEVVAVQDQGLQFVPVLMLQEL
jgi:hypothetical protein